MSELPVRDPETLEGAILRRIDELAELLNRMRTQATLLDAIRRGILARNGYGWW